MDPLIGDSSQSVETKHLDYWQQIEQPLAEDWLVADWLLAALPVIVVVSLVIAVENST